MMYMIMMTMFLSIAVPVEAVQYEVPSNENWTHDYGDAWAQTTCILGVVCYCGWCTRIDGYGCYDAVDGRWYEEGDNRGKGEGTGAGTVPYPASSLNAWLKKTPRQKNRRLQRAKYRNLRDSAAARQDRDEGNRGTCTSEVNSVSPTVGVGNGSIITDDECSNTLFFSNITEWGPQAKRYFMNESVGVGEEEHAEGTPRWEAIGMVEHHLPHEKAGKMHSAFAELGFRCTISAASKSRKTATGTNGGAAIAVPRNRSTTLRNPGQEVTEGGPALNGEGWSVVILHRHGIDIAYAVAYFICGGFKTFNKRLAYELKVCFRALRIP